MSGSSLRANTGDITIEGMATIGVANIGLPSRPSPFRPLSCGEFRFWDGEHCVDVRFR